MTQLDLDPLELRALLAAYGMALNLSIRDYTKATDCRQFFDSLVRQDVDPQALANKLIAAEPGDDAA